MSKEEDVTHLLRPVIEEMNLEWVGVEYHHNSVNSILRIYLDKEGGITMEDVVAATEIINPILDVNDPIGSMYTLEVSSPGLDRPLFTLTDFERFTGSLVKIQLRVPIEHRRRFEAVIKNISGDQIIIEYQDGKELRTQVIDFKNIDKARLVPIFED